MLEWADLIFTMEPVHKRLINARFTQLLKTRRIIVLNIPDNYDYLEPALITSLKAKVLPHLQRSAPGLKASL